MEDEQDCGYDYIQVFNGFDDSGNSYGKFCGNKVLSPSSNAIMARAKTFFPLL